MTVPCIDRSAADRLAKTVEEACSLLANYNSRLAEELQERRRIARLLREFILLQKTLLAEDEKKVEVRSLLELTRLHSQGTKIQLYLFSRSSMKFRCNRIVYNTTT
jgi:hypothetical protein